MGFKAGCYLQVAGSGTGTETVAGKVQQRTWLAAERLLPATTQVVAAETDSAAELPAAAAHFPAAAAHFPAAAGEASAAIVEAVGRLGAVEENFAAGRDAGIHMCVASAGEPVSAAGWCPVVHGLKTGVHWKWLQVSQPEKTLMQRGRMDEPSLIRRAAAGQHVMHGAFAASLLRSRGHENFPDQRKADPEVSDVGRTCACQCLPEE